MVFQKITKYWGHVTVDLFANLWNCQVQSFYSWRPQPQAMVLDALTQPWPQKGGYAFPPWVLIPKVIQKIRKNILEIILITPIWPKTCWFSHLVEMSVEHPFQLPQNQILEDADGNPPQIKANLRKNFALAAWKLSGDISRVKVFRNQIKISSATKHEPAPINYMTITGRNGLAGVLPEGSLLFQQI